MNIKQQYSTQLYILQMNQTPEKPVLKKLPYDLYKHDMCIQQLRIQALPEFNRV